MLRQLVALVLHRRRLEHQRLQFLGAGPGAQRALQVNLVVAQQAGAQLAVRRQAEAVALLAEAVGDGADEADGARRPRQAEVLGRAVPVGRQAGSRPPSSASIRP